MGLPLSKQIAIVIVAWNQLDKTLACLETVYAQTTQDFDVILVDNGSNADFAEQIEKAFEKIILLRSDRNRGFAGGNNIGIRYALDNKYQCILLLNNDTLLAVDCIETLLSTLNSSPANVGAVSAKIFYAHEKNRIWTVGADFHPLLLEIIDEGKGQIDSGQWDEVKPIEFAPFCGILLKRSVFEQVGLLDDAYFLYYEDMDYCQKLKARGIKISLVPDAKIWHAVSASSGGNQSAAALYWLANSSGRYFRAHSGYARLLIIIPYRLMSALRKTFTLAKKEEWQPLKSYWRGLYHGWVTQTHSSCSIELGNE